MNDNPIYDNLDKSEPEGDTPVYDNAWFDHLTGAVTEGEPEPSEDNYPHKWMPSRDVRLWLYSIAIAAAILLIGYGALTIAQGGLWLSLVGALLGFAPAVAARNVPPKG